MRHAVLLICPMILLAQDTKFGVQSRLVLVPVTITDAKNRPVDGLDPSNFNLQDNGALQRVTVEESVTGVAPIALMVAVQSAGISAPVLAKVQKIGSMIQPLITGERGCAGLAAFDETVHWVQECTGNPDELSSAFASLHPGPGKTAHMLDAVNQAIERLHQRANTRRVLLLISETRDRGSETELDVAVAAAQVAGVSVYAATYSAFTTAFTTKTSRNDPPPESDIPRPNQTRPQSAKGPVPIPPPEQRMDILGGIGELVRLGKVKDTEVLTSRTGGTTFPFTRLKGLEEAIGRLGEELHSQYLLSFAPETPAPGYHRIDVQINKPGKFQIRARPGYWATQ